MVRKTRVRRHKRRKPTGGYTDVKEHTREISDKQQIMQDIERDIEQDLSSVNSSLTESVGLFIDQNKIDPNQIRDIENIGVQGIRVKMEDGAEWDEYFIALGFGAAVNYLDPIVGPSLRDASRFNQEYWIDYYADTLQNGAYVFKSRVPTQDDYKKWRVYRKKGPHRGPPLEDKPFLKNTYRNRDF